MILPSFCAGVAQLVEHFLAKEDVASSSLVTRFRPLVPRGLERGTARNLHLAGKLDRTQRAKASRRSSTSAERRRTSKPTHQVYIVASLTVPGHVYNDYTD